MTQERLDTRIFAGLQSQEPPRRTRYTPVEGPCGSRDGERLYGRGTADNKGQHTINIAALEAVMAERGGRLGFNARFILEMGEESGSKGLAELVAANKAAFAADVLVASDGPRVKQERPTMTLGCRGAINFDLVCDLREGGHHSGNWGGLIANPGVILANAIASIATGQNFCCGQSTAHMPTSAITSATRAISKSPPVQCTTAKARSAHVPVVQIVNRGNCSTSHSRFKPAMAAR